MSIHVVPLSDSRGLGESFRIPFNHLLHICNHWLHLHITVLVECEVIKIFPLHISDRCMMSLFAGKGVVWDVGELWRSGELESGCFRGCTIRSSCNFPSISSRSRLVARALLYPPPYVCFFPRARTPLSCPKLLKCGKWIRRK